MRSKSTGPKIKISVSVLQQNRRPTLVLPKNRKTTWNIARPLILPISSETLSHWNGVRPKNAIKKYRTEDLNFCLRTSTEQKVYTGSTQAYIFRYTYFIICVSKTKSGRIHRLYNELFHTEQGTNCCRNEYWRRLVFSLTIVYIRISSMFRFSALRHHAFLGISRKRYGNKKMRHGRSTPIFVQT